MYRSFLLITLLFSSLFSQESKVLFNITVGKAIETVYKQKPYVSENECIQKGENFIFAGGECINFISSEGYKEDEITIFFHAAYPIHSNVLNIYSTFVEDLSMETDITTIAVALPGYSGSSTNKFTPIILNKNKDLILKKDFILFVGNLIENLKEKFGAKKINFIGHSSGAMIGALLSGDSPKLVNKYILAGGRYNQIAKNDNEDFLSVKKVLSNINKNTRVLLLYGTKDKISEPIISKEYYSLSKEKDLNIKIVEILDSTHINLGKNELSFNQINKFLDN